MPSVHIANDAHWVASFGGASAQRYARFAGVLYLISILAGGFGELYVPSALIVSGDAAATARNIMTSPLLFRAGFAGYLVEAVCDVTLTLLLYVLLRPVNRNLSLLAAFLGLVATSAFAIGEFFYLAASQILSGSPYLGSFSPAQLHTLALLALKMYGYGGDAFMAIGGTGAMVLGYLIARSRYLPKALGILLALGGAGLISTSFATVLVPAYASPVLLLPILLSTLLLGVWMFVKGVDVRRWEDRAASADAIYCRRPCSPI
jgi:hypothetical protein